MRVFEEPLYNLKLEVARLFRRWYATALKGLAVESPSS